MTTNEPDIGPGSRDDNQVTELSANLYKAKGWIKLAGVLSIISGILTIFSIWGIIICWLPIWMGVLLTRVAGRVEMAYLRGDAAMFQEATDNLRKYFTITGVAALIYIVLMAGFLLMMLTMGGLGALGAFD